MSMGEVNSKWIPTKVLHVIPTLGRGGAERQLVDICRYSNPKVLQHSVVTLFNKNLLLSELQDRGILVTSLNLEGKHPWIKGAIGLRKLIRNLKPDVIHSWLMDGHVTASLANRLGGSFPSVGSIQCADYDEDTIRYSGWPRYKVEIFRQIESWSCSRNSSRWIPCSDFVLEASHLQLGIPKGRMVRIYNALDPVRLSAPEAPAIPLRQQWNIPEKAIICFTAGRLDPQKGHSVALGALKTVLTKNSNVFLVIAGAGPLHNPLVQMANDYGISANVRLIGLRTDLAACLKTSDIFVFPSLFEGFGVALIEAMFMGIPIIASNTGPIPEIFQQQIDGILIRPGSAEDLSREILALCENPERRASLARAAKKTCEHRFLFSEPYMDQWNSIYKEAKHGSRC